MKGRDPKWTRQARERARWYSIEHCAALFDRDPAALARLYLRILVDRLKLEQAARQNPSCHPNG